MGRRSTDKIALEQAQNFSLICAGLIYRAQIRETPICRKHGSKTPICMAPVSKPTKSIVTPVFAMPTVHTPVLGRSICQAQTFLKPKSTKCLATGLSPCPVPISAPPILAQPNSRITPRTDDIFIKNTKNAAQTPKPILRHSPRITPQYRPTRLQTVCPLLNSQPPYL